MKFILAILISVCLLTAIGSAAVTSTIVVEKFSTPTYCTIPYTVVYPYYLYRVQPYYYRYNVQPLVPIPELDPIIVEKQVTTTWHRPIWLPRNRVPSPVNFYDYNYPGYNRSYRGLFLDRDVVVTYK
jgi:hypothetical protein